MPRQLTDRALPEPIPPWGILVLESHHSPDFEMEWRTHAFAKIVYVLQGQGTFHLGTHSESFVAGDVVVVAAGVRNRIEDDPASAASLYVCCIDKSVCHFDSSFFQQMQTGLLRGDGHFANRVASSFRRLVHTQQRRSTLRPAMMVSDALRLMVTIEQRAATQERVTTESGDPRSLVQAYIESLPDHFFEEHSIDTAAAQLNISRRTFTRLFAEITGETWLQHIRRLGIEHARQRLIESDVPIPSIAFECGFNDLSTFYRQFNKLTGTAPGHFRQSMR